MLLTIVLVNILVSGVWGQGADLDKVIKELNTKIASSQITKPDESLLWKKQVGLYPCNVRNNFCKSSDSEFLRDSIAVYDNNAFVTLWVSIILLETVRFHKGDLPLPSQDQMYNAIDALSTYHDRNYPSQDGISVFWPQRYNSSLKIWYSYPDNVELAAGELLNSFNLLHKIMKDLGLEKLWLKLFQDEDNQLESELNAFNIPADFDDTFVNLGLGSMLSNYPLDKTLFERWWRNNTNFVQVFKALKKYAYRPFSNDSDKATIDPRTYFYIREFLYEIQDANSSAAFVTTWVEDMEENDRTPTSYAMPFNVNNVDLTVGANVVYGLTAAVLANLGNPEEWFDKDLQMIYENTTNLMAWCIERNFSSRPDLALTYYPSVFNFYWFTARTLNLLQTYSSTNDLPYAVMTRVKERLSSALRINATNWLIKKAIRDGESERTYFEDFLGKFDVDLIGKPVNHGEDRLCSTAVAINTLLYTWMEGNKLLPSIPSSVLSVINNSVEWLAENILSGKHKPFNVLFSGSVKVEEDLPFFFPANVQKYINGSAIPDGRIGPEARIAVDGIIPKKDYEKMLTEKHFGLKTLVDFRGYDSAFPFWSSESFTYASSMLALTQYRYLLESGQI